jgi:ribonuclease PH
MRRDGRLPQELRTITVQRPFRSAAPGSLLIAAGRTCLLCTASIEESVPPWKLKSQPQSGWLTAEYSMLPGSTAPRKTRDRSGKLDGRSSEIQRLIGRSLRAAVDLEALGPRTMTIDCDVLEADGGTRTLAITGGYIALVDAVRSLQGQGVDPTRVLRQRIAAVSVGLVDGRALLDLDYSEDSRAEVDLNVVLTDDGRLVEVQGTAEGRPFSREELQNLLDLALQGGRDVGELQNRLLGG